MGKYFRVFNVPFQKLLDIREADGVSPKVNLFVADPRSYIARGFEPSGPTYDFLSKHNVEDVLLRCEGVIKAETWVHILLQRPVSLLERCYPEMGESWFWLIVWVFSWSEC